MIDLSALPEPQFVTVDWNQQYSDLVSTYEQIVGLPLSTGQVESLILATFEYRENLLRININETAKQNLLAYALNGMLDQLGAFLGITRLPAAAALTTLRFTFQSALTTSLLVPAGTRAMSKDNNATFATSQDATAAIGSSYIDVPAQCTAAGATGNGYLAGDINQLIDPLPYVSTVANTTFSYGGADIESDDHFRSRIQTAPESFSTAGPEGAYKFWTLSANQDIVDAAVWMPTPGTVNVAPLLTGGAIPDSDMLALVASVLTPTNMRPLTDQVIVVAPEVVNYSITVQIYIYKSASMLSDTILSQANAAVAAYVSRISETLGAGIVPEQIAGALQDISGVYRAVVTSPEYTELSQNQVAICSSTSVTIAGTTDR